MSKLTQIVYLCYVLLLNSCLSERYADFSPCPKLFNYFISQTSEIFGAMTLKNDYSGKYDLQVNMSIALDTRKSIRITLRTDPDKVQNGEDIEYYVHFPFNHTIPRLTSVTFNGKLYCLGPPEIPTPNHAVSALSARHFFATTIADGMTPERTSPATFVQSVINSDIYKYPECGKKVGLGHRNQGFKGLIPSADYPWLVAIFLLQNASNSYKFICGGNLISTKHVLTGANCLRDKFGSNVTSEELVIALGRHNIKKWVRSTIRSVERYYIHQDYRISADADIALLVLEKPVTFSETIKPICLWDENKALDVIVNNTGVVVAWGTYESGKLYEEPQEIKFRIVAQETCVNSDFRFHKLISMRTFCAGNMTVVEGTCMGYNGSGFVMERNGIWKLRGIAAIALVDPASLLCDVNKYIVFSDVAKHVEWIQKLMDTH